MSLFIIILFVSLVVVVLVGAFLDEQGCSGDCSQGRKCNCKDKENGN